MKALEQVKDLGKALRPIMLNDAVKKYIRAKRQRHFMPMLLTDSLGICALINNMT